MDGPVYVFLDEAGNFDFSPNGTRYFILTALVCRRPFPWGACLDELVYELLEAGVEVEYLHASKQPRKVKQRVFQILSDCADKFAIHSVIVEKRKTAPPLQTIDRFYPHMLGYLLRWILWQHRSAKEVVVITDRLPHKGKRKAVESAVKPTLARFLPDDANYRVLHHEARAHAGLQLVDFCTWAIHRRWSQGDEWPYSAIKTAIKSEFEIFRTGRTYYY